MLVQEFHQEFRLNEYQFTSVQELINYVATLDTTLVDFLETWFDENEYVVVQTSGSTGKPKQIKLKKEYMINSAIATGAFFDLKEKTTALLCMPTAYIAGKMMVVRAMVLGWSLDVISPTSNPFEKNDKSYDFSAVVPMQLYKSLPYIYKVKKMIVGGGVVSSTYLQKIQELPTQIYATYGMTETITHIAVKKLNHITKEIEEKYKTLPGVNIETDIRGCLVINAPRISSEKVVTNDMVTIYEANTFEWLGRYDHVINSGGIKLHPEKIEAKLERYISERFFVAGMSDELLGEKLVLVIEGKEQDVDIQIAKGTLERYEIPKTTYYIHKFVETPTGKIQRTKTLALLR